MLHAFSRNKRNDWKDKFNSGKVEDAITSTLLGPLDFFPPKISWLFWKDIIQYNKPSFEPQKCTIEFWPKNNHCEPDIKIEYSSKQDTKIIILVEIKWNSPDSNKNPKYKSQLHQQWNIYLTSDERKIAHHVFIGKTTEQANNLTKEDKSKLWENRLTLKTWNEIKKILKNLPGSSPDQLKKWAELTVRFLEVMDDSIFSGFSGVFYKSDQEEPIAPLPCYPIFFSEFSGFKNLTIPTNSINYQQFFEEKS